MNICLIDQNEHKTHSFLHVNISLTENLGRWHYFVVRWRELFWSGRRLY